MCVWNLLRRVFNSPIDFRQFVMTLACFRPVKAKHDDSDVNSRLAKLYCTCCSLAPNLLTASQLQGLFILLMIKICYNQCAICQTGAAGPVSTGHKWVGCGRTVPLPLGVKPENVLIFWRYNPLFWGIFFAWHMPVFRRRTFPVLRSTCS